jgi:tetratricopeptide (TPR) repeat protein
MSRHRAALVAAFLLGLPVLALAAAQDPEAEMRFGAGIRLLRDGFPDRALTEIEAALKKEPDNAFYLKGLSVAYSQLADKCKPNDSGCRNNNLKKAIDAAQKALIANPDYVDARNDLGIALLRLGKRTEGKAELAKAFADPQCPTPEVTAWNLGQAFLEEKEYNEAMTWFTAAQNKNKTLAASYVSIAEILSVLGQPDAAILQLETGLKESSGNTMVHLALGDAYLKAGRYQDARSALEQVIKKDPAGQSGRQAALKLKSIPQ